MTDDDGPADIRVASRALARAVVGRRLGRPRPVPGLQRGLVEDLAGAGVVISDVWDLVGTTGRYRAAAPVLMSRLDRVDEAPGGSGSAKG